MNLIKSMLIVWLLAFMAWSAASATEEKLCRILPRGDFIAEGGNSFSNYRYPLLQKLTAAVCYLKFTGSGTSASPLGLLRHEGYSCKNAEFLAGVLEKKCRTNAAVIILIQSGHNHKNTEASVRGIAVATEAKKQFPMNSQTI